MSKKVRAATLDLVNLDDEAFTQLYTHRVEPLLKAREGERQKAVKACVWRGSLGTVVALGITGVSFNFFDVDAVIIIGCLSFGAVYWYAFEPINKVAATAKIDSLSAISQAIGCEYEYSGFTPDAFPKFNELLLLPPCDRSGYHDRFGGHHHGCAFAFCDGHLERKVRSNKSTRWVTVFRGQLIKIAFPKQFLGLTIVRRDAGMFNFLERWSSSLDRVGLNDSRMEKAFEVYSNDQVEARYLLHPVFMERLLELETRFKGKNLRCAFVEGNLLIVVEGGDKFEIGSMFSPLADASRVRTIVDDLSEILRLIDAVLTAERGALPTA